MKINATLFGSLAAFYLVIAFVYGFVTGFEELAGFPLLLLTAGLGFMLWFYLRLTAKHHHVMDGDNPGGEIHEQAGVYGDFAPWSWWPLGLGFSSAMVFFGVAIGWWFFFIGCIPALFFVTGWVMEYNRKRYAH